MALLILLYNRDEDYAILVDSLVKDLHRKEKKMDLLEVRYSRFSHGPSYFNNKRISLWKILFATGVPDHHEFLNRHEHLL